MDDAVRLEILLNRFQAIVDEMAQVVSRTAFTVFVKETQDYGTALVSREGEVFAASRRYGVLMMIGTPMEGALAAIGDDVAQGDVFIANDPDATRGMATHLSDVYLWKPVFCDGRLLCWAWTFIHVSDVGGRVPGSIAPSSEDVYQEGLRITPQKLFRAGELNRPLLDMILANCRTADQNWGDMKACLAGLATAERRTRELAARHGAEVVDATIVRALDYAEAQARRVIAHVPDGTYRYSDYIEADMAGLGLVRIHVALTVAGGEMLLDFTGTAPQVRAALNIPTWGRDGHWMLITGLVNWICTQEPGIAYNAGLVRPMRVRIPKGTILNPEPGAACGARYATSHKVCDVTVGALAQAVPMELPATDSGQGSILLVSVPDFENGGRKISVVQPIVGGAGGRPCDDGIDGTMVILNFLKNIPTEIFENEMPEILIRHYGLREDSGGPGAFRGGHGYRDRVRDLLALHVDHVALHGTLHLRSSRPARRPHGRDGLHDAQSRYGSGAGSGQDRRSRTRARRHTAHRHPGRRRLRRSPGAPGGEGRRGCRQRRRPSRQRGPALRRCPHARRRARFESDRGAAGDRSCPTRLARTAALRVRRRARGAFPALERRA